MLYMYIFTFINFFLDLQSIVAEIENMKNKQLLIRNEMRNFNTKFD